MRSLTPAAIVGVGNTNFHSMYRSPNPERSSYDLGVSALDAALDDCGMSKHDIDALLCMRIPSYEILADRIGIRRIRYSNYYVGDGRMSGIVLQHAVSLIQSGLATTVACVYGNNGRSASATYGGDVNLDGNQAYDQMFGMTSPGAYVSLMYRRYRHIYNAPDDSLAPLAINNRAHAALNGDAVMQTPITYDEYMASRYVAEPLRLFDYCLINDGGVAMIVTTPERAKDLKKKPVYVQASATAADLKNFYSSDDFFQKSTEMAAKDLYEASGLGPGDVDCLQIYDNFTPTILFSLEGFGYAPKGQAWQLVRDKSIAFDGDLPINTSGGHTGESYMQGWGHQVEAVRQLRGEAGARQVKDCNVVHYMCVAPLVLTHMLTNDLG